MFAKCYLELLFVGFWQLCFIQGLQAATKMKTFERIEEARNLAFEVSNTLYTLFESCLHSPMPNQQFLTDNIQGFVNYPSKTTVGFGPKYTNNRKYFANMLSSPAFKEMLMNDLQELRKEFIKKLEYCDQAIMDQQILAQLYDREVDQSLI